MEASSSRAVDQLLVTKVVSSYVKKNQLSPADMPALINTVYQSLMALGKPLEPEAPIPVVPIRRSVTRDYVVCLACGWRGRSLRRHIRERHGLNVDEYRARWKLPLHHVLVAPAYSERRVELAKHLRGRPSAEETVRPRRQRRAKPTALPDPTSAG
jgi:predicted transcriptional regulator